MSEGNFTFSNGAHVHGPLGVGGNLIINSSSPAEINMDAVGTYVFPGDGSKTTGLLVKGGVTWTSGMAKVLNARYIHIGSSSGSIQSDNNTNSATQVLPSSTSYNNSKRIEGTIDQTPNPAVFQSVGFDFSTLFNIYRSNSQVMASVANTVQLQNANGAYLSGNTVPSAQSVQISSLSNGVNYLNLTQASLGNITELKFNSGATPSATKLVVINVPLTSNFVWNNSNMPGLSGANNGAYILWNFSGTSTYNLTLNTASLLIGTVYAPNHNFIKNGNGDIDGNVVAKTINLNIGEVHFYPFNGNIPVIHEICNNGLDDDFDGVIDLNDADCQCTTPVMSFQSPTLLSGTANSVGAVYRFNNVMQGVHAKLTIVSFSHSDIKIASLDEPEATNGGYNWAFQPIIDYNWFNGNNSWDAAGERSVVFKIDFIDATTGSASPVPVINMTAVDVDGNDYDVREFIQSNGFQSYQLQSPTQLTLSGSLRALGPVGAFDGVDETALTSMISYVFENKSSLTVTYGSVYNGQKKTDEVSDSRMNCLYFKCYNFNSSYNCPSVSITGGGSFCPGNNAVLAASLSNGIGTCQLQWQTSTDGVTWLNVAGATNNALTVTPATALKYYRASYYCSSQSSCGTAYSDAISVVLNYSQCPELCSNGLDDDGDGFADCADTNCQPAFTSQPAGATICSGGTHTLNVLASGSATYQWQISTNNSSFTNISGATSVSYTTTALTATTYYRAMVTLNGCSLASSTATVTVVADPTISTQPVGSTICAGGTQTLSVTATGGTPNLTYQWQSSTDNSTFTNINGATGNSYAAPALTATTYYRVVISAAGNGCGSVTSSVATVTVAADPAITTQPASASICTGGTQTLSVTASGGTPSLTYQWQSSANNSTFTNISGAMSSSYTTPALTATTYYRVIVSATGTDCGSATSSVATVTVVADPAITAQPTSASVCSGSTQTLSVTATGGTPSLSYQWQSSANNSTFANISGATGSSYTTSALTATTYYRVVVSAAGNGCGSVTSSVATVTVAAGPAVTAQPVSSTICMGGTHAMSVTATGGTPSLAYQWQSSTDNSTFTNINGATGSSYTTPALTATTYYRVVVSAAGNGCGSVTSSVTTVTVVADPAITTQPASASICTGGTQTLSVTATGGTPSLTYQWQSSTNNATFTNISGATGSSYTTPALTATTYYQVVVSAAGNGCGSVTSSVATVTVVADPAITAQPASATICSGSTHAMSITATGGTPSLTYQWQSSANNSTFTDISGATSSSYTTPALTATTYYRVVVSASGNGCGSVTSSVAIVTVAAGAAITVQPTSNAICMGGTHAMSVTATGGTPSLAYQWQSSTDNSTFTNINGATGSSYTTPALTATTYYRVVVSASGNGCGSVTSAAAAVTVVADPAITAQPASTSICVGGTHAMSVTATGGTPSLTYQWQSSANNSTFTNISGATSSSYTTPALTATTYYRVVVSATGTDCGSVTSSVATVTVVADPAITAQPTSVTTCLASTQMLSVTATGGTPSLSYQWQNSANNSTFTDISGATGSSYTTPALTATTYYRVVVSAAGNGCGSVTSSVATVTVAAGPAITVQPIGSTICVGGTHAMSVTATGGTPSLAYQWQSSTDNLTFTNINGATGSNYSASALAATTYYQVVVSAAGNGCGSVTSSVATVTVAADPAITTQPANTSICLGGSATLSVVATGGTPNLSYQWQSSLTNLIFSDIAGANSATYNTPAALLPMYYRVVVSATGSGCGSVTSSTATVSIGVGPVALVLGNTTICTGSTTTLSATGGTAYAWSTGATTAAITVAPIANTTYTVTITGLGGCTGTSPVTVTVNSLPTANAGADVSICAGSSTTLTASGGTAYAWSHSLGSGATKTVSPTTATTYTVTVTNANGCTATDQVLVGINPSPVASVSSNQTICSGTSVNITASATGGVAPYTFAWNNGLGTGTSKTVNPATSTNYIVTVTGSNGCTATKQTSIIVSAMPVANAGADITICNGASTTLSASGSGAASPYTYTWSDGGVGASHVVSPIATTTYTVTVTSSNGCFSVDQKVVTVQSCAENCSNGLDDDADGYTDCADSNCGPLADAGSDISICNGNTASLTVSVSGGTTPYSYAWSNGLGTGSTKMVSPSVNTTYTVTVTSTTGCTSTDQIAVTVNTCSENCTNGIDDDGDSLVDCEDPGCSGITAPVLVNDDYATCPGMTYSNRVTYNDGNLNSPIFSIAVQPQYGTVTIDWTGKFIYIPNSFECATDHFTYQVCNQGSGCCAQAVVSILLGDHGNPVLTNVPADLTISCDDEVPIAPIITAFDECPGLYMDFEEATDQNFAGACGSYTITRTWKATDFCGNTISEDQLISVLDQTKPEVFQMYTLEGGAKLVAGFAERVTHEWKYIRFPITFKAAPVVLANIGSNNDLTAVTTNVRNVSMQGFEVRLREEEAQDGSHGIENVSWIAVEPSVQTDNLKWEAGTFANVNDQTDTLVFSQTYAAPLFFSSYLTNNQPDPATLRHSNLTTNSVELFGQEEQSAITETSRLNETIGYLALNANTPLVDNDGNVFGEAGKIDITHAWTTVALSGSYTKPVVIVGGVSNQDNEPLTIRVRNVEGNKFEVRIQEWNYQDGGHSTESIAWLVVEGSIPGNSSFYCSGKDVNLRPNVNVFAIDNCDDLLTFNHDKSSSQNIAGLISSHAWTAIDDCGNSTSLSRFDTCQVAALQLKALLYGAITGNAGGNNLMRDNLRLQKLLPTIEPYSAIPSLPYVEYVIHSIDLDTILNAILDPMVTICHKPGTSEQAPMTVKLTELPFHLAHGDLVGDCGSSSLGMVTICHKPGTAAQKTKVIPLTSLLAHLAHGDVIGSCSGAGNDTPTTAQHRTIADGAWTDAATWQSGNVPPLTNINNKTISIEHNVTIQNSDLHLKNNSTLWVSHGSIKMSNGNFRIEKSTANFVNSTFDGSAAGNIELTSNQSRLEMTDCVVKVGQNFTNTSGVRKLKNVQLEVNHNYNNTTGKDTLINVCAIIDNNVSNALLGKLYLHNVKMRLLHGSFSNTLGNVVSGDSLVLLVETRSLLNLGIWSADVLYYCVADSLSLPLISLPSSQSCVNIANYFNPCECEHEESTNTGAPPTSNVDNSLFETPLSDDNVINAGKSLGGGTIASEVLDIVGPEAVVDWLLVEIRSMNNEAQVLGYQSVVLQRDGDIVSESGDSVLIFAGLEEGDYYVSVRHRNHLGLMTNTPIFLTVTDPALVDFTDPLTPIRGGLAAARLSNGKRTMWGGDYNNDGKVVYQGPYNDVFYLFSRVIGDGGNETNLANFIIPGYEMDDFNLDGRVIFQGPNNDRAPLLYNSVLAHSGNGNLLANYIVLDFLP